MRLNAVPIHPYGTTHEGAHAASVTTEQALRRSVMSCFLWETEFYEDGKEISERISALASKVSVSKVAELAIEARMNGNLRHVPLLLLSTLARRHEKGFRLADTIECVIQRTDELAELLAVHAHCEGIKPSEIKKHIPAQMKRGLAAAFRKFNEYQLAKYNRDGAIKLRDVLFLCHPRPKDAEQEALWKRLAENGMKIPDTWEVQLSSGADKRTTFERLICEGKLGYLALLRNLHNMVVAGCDPDLVKDAIIARKGSGRVLPFRYVAAARAAPMYEPALDQALRDSIAESPALSGKTIVLVDVSGSMEAKLTGNSDLTRMDAAAALASIIHGDLRVFTFSTDTIEVAPRRGMAGVDMICGSQYHCDTNLGKAISTINQYPHDRIIVITDEQSSDNICAPVAKRAYMINVASAKNGVGYGRHWVHIDGFSESVLRFINIYENDF